MEKAVILFSEIRRTVSNSLVVWHNEMKIEFFFNNLISSFEGESTLSVISALANKSFEELTIVAPAFLYSSSDINDSNPAPDSI